MIQQNQAGGNAVTAKRAVFEYNALNQRTKLTRYQSTGTSNLVGSSEYAFDTVNRLSSLTHKQNTTVLAGYTYGYDGVSRLTSVTSTIEGLSSFTYDATSQVTVADHAVGGQADESYGYDLIGNRNTSGYTTSTNNRTTVAPGFTYTYDDQGNRTSRTETSTGKVTEYAWDHRNRLTIVKDRNTAGGSVVKQVDYAYDAFNRLVKRTYDADGAGAGAATSQFWVYDEGINAVLQFDGPAASNLTHRYLWTGVVDELMADETVGSGADTLYALGDHLGTIRDIANFNESTSVTSVTNHRTYNSFGKLTAETNAAVDLIFGYTGKQLDEATGLQHNLFHWYDSALGQWLSEDPLGFVAGDENVRRYVGNNPTTYRDVLGLFQHKDLIDVQIVIHYYFQTYAIMEKPGVNPVLKEVQRILDDAMKQHGDPAVKISVTFMKLATKDEFDKARGGVNGNWEYKNDGRFSKRYKKLDVYLYENSSPKEGSYGQGAGYKGYVVSMLKMQEALRINRSQGTVADALAATIVHEGLFHGTRSQHLTKEGFIDSEQVKVDGESLLSSGAAKYMLKAWGIANPNPKD